MPSRVSVRALSRTVALGVAVAAGLGGAVTAVAMADTALSKGRAERMAEAAQNGFSEAALQAQREAMSPSAAAIAERFDPYAVSGEDAEAALIRTRLERSRTAVSQSANRIGPAAKPFQAGGAVSGARELECLTQAVYYEARGEGSAGQAAVAQVVLNRVRHPAFPKSVCGVVFQGASVGKCQFSFACDGSIRRGRETGAWRRAQRVAASALSGHVVAELGNATHFHAARVSPNWGGLVRVASVGQHVFYRFGGRSGAPNSFRARYRPEAEVATVYASMLPTAISGAATLPQLLTGEAPAAQAQAEAQAQPAAAPSTPAAPEAAQAAETPAAAPAPVGSEAAPAA